MKTWNLPDLRTPDPNGPNTQLLHDSDNAWLVLFSLEPGQVVPPHVSPSEVIMHMISGSGIFSAGENEIVAKPGTIVACAPDEPHGMRADEPSLVLATITPRP